MLEILKRIEALREELHNAIDKGNADEILQKSREILIIIFLLFQFFLKDFLCYKMLCMKKLPNFFKVLF